MPKSPSEILAGCVTAADAAALTEARRACGRIAERVKYVETGNAGRIVAAVNFAEEAVFEALNYANSYGYCNEAARAIEEYWDDNR